MRKDSLLYEKVSDHDSLHTNVDIQCNVIAIIDLKGATNNQRYMMYIKFEALISMIVYTPFVPVN